MEISHCAGRLLLPNSRSMVGFKSVTAHDAQQAPLPVIEFPHGLSVKARRMRCRPIWRSRRAGRYHVQSIPLWSLDGVGGSALNYHDATMALVYAGFVMSAARHAGDNSQDRSGPSTAETWPRGKADQQGHRPRPLIARPCRGIQLCDGSGEGCLIKTRRN